MDLPTREAIFLQRDQNSQTKHKVGAHSWKLVRESRGLEISSPILDGGGDDSWKVVGQLVQALRHAGVRTDAHTTYTHVSIDSQTLTLPEIKRVLKNLLVVEPALASLLVRPRDAPRTPLPLKKKPTYTRTLASQFNTTSDAIQAVDACPTLACVEESLYKQGGEHVAKRYLMRLQHGRFEFRGHTSRLDPEFMVAWVQLRYGIVLQSASGAQVDDGTINTKGTTSEPWSALFDEVVLSKRFVDNHGNSYHFPLAKKTPAAPLCSSKKELPRHHAGKIFGSITGTSPLVLIIVFERSATIRADYSTVVGLLLL